MKKNIYLSCLASKLMQSTKDNLVDADIQFMTTCTNDKLVIKVKPANPILQKYSVFIHALPEVETFKESRFIPSLNNVRFGWYFETTGDGMFLNASFLFKNFNFFILFIEFCFQET